MAWCTQGEFAPKKAKVSRSVEKVCVTVFQGLHGILPIKYAQKNLQTKKSNVTSHTYENVWKKLQTVISRLQPWLHDQNVFLFNDNTRPHMAIINTQLLVKLGCTIFNHLPYSPDLVLSDFFLFPRLKKSMSGTTFLSNEKQKSIQLTPPETIDRLIV